MSSPPEWVNAKQAAGEHQIKHAALFDAEVRPHNERFRAATQVGPRDQVLDIGCGTGQSTRQAARAATGGSALGVDLSAAAVRLANRISDQEGLRNAVFQQADAQVHRFKPRHYDLCISQFGTMFKDALARMDAETAEHARDRLRAILEEHATRDGVFFGSRAWIITARRP